MQTKRLYREGKRVEGEHSLTALAEHRASANCTVWVDLTLDEEGALDELATLLDLHQLAVEDARSHLERPRLARFDSHLLLTLSASECDEEGAVEISRLTAFILPGILVTVHEDRFPIDAVATRLDDNEELSTYGVPWLVWALLDIVVDSHTDSVERLDEVIEALSDGLFSERPDTSEVQRRAFTLRRSVSKLRHATLPLKEVITLLIHQGEEKVAPELHPYFADVGDHAGLAADWSETLADHISTAIETSIALQGNKMNEIMKKVTGWAAIIAVPTAITGFFGMNVDFPGHDQVEGLIASIALVIGSSVVLYIVFKRRDWL
ncbi:MULTISPECIES: magnesium transporter CorA family protein [unclassified Pseudoclavibacter]|uniref:magnesium transporter CorA family protein n=1 Tax=unclassified Pseudoclavibacter TaxID=2615177 RepID=UPI0015E418EE|nr:MULTISPECIES: magnesium transporter CorA family protein [unclassified Pseudoclavibacter]